MKQRVLTIHGINDLGEWQDEVHAVLAPHFECVALKYAEYQDHGELKILFDLGRKSRTLEDLLEKYESATAGRVRPHLIAHSFGTVLSTALMHSWPAVRFARLLFVGSALPPQFDWSNLLSEDPEKFYDLRNETGGRDWVARLAGWAGKLGWDLGDAGWAGFSGSGIHTLKGPLQRCHLCQNTKRESQRVRIHNAPLRELDHSGVFASRRHATEVWLPYLWGFSPADYLEFLELCQQVMQMQDSGACLEARKMEERLRAWQWGWMDLGQPERATFGQYVRAYLEQFLEDYGVTTTPERLVKLEALVLRGTCELVIYALEERDKPDGKEEAIRALHPRIAVTRAVEALRAVVVGATPRP